MLNAYVILLLILCGAECQHLMAVVALRTYLQEAFDMAHAMGPNLIADILWAVFTDARKFFSQEHSVTGAPPTSSLHVVVAMLSANIQVKTEGTPYQELLGTPRSMQPGAGVGPPLPAMVPRSDPFGPPAPSVRTNSNMYPKILELTQPIRSVFPAVQFKDVFQAAMPKLTPQDTSLAKKNCLDYLVIGKCPRPGCMFNHEGNLDAASVDALVANLAPAFTRLYAQHSGNAQPNRKRGRG